MKNTDKLILVGLLLGAFWLLFTDDHNQKVNLPPDNLYQKMVENTRYFSSEEIAHKIISKDPSLQLIDVREDKFYNKFTLMGAINIPLKDILKQENQDYFDQDIYQTVLFSNGTSDANVAWLLMTRLGYKNVYVMKGGLNAWVEEILEPKEHSVVWDRIDNEMYQYRKGASQFFGGKADTPSDESATVKPKKKIKKRKKKEVEGGCG
jgi:rhodanese-related sulfurtransferase